MTSDDNNTVEKWAADFRQAWEEHLSDWTKSFPTVGNTIVRAKAEFGDSFGEELRATLIPIDDHFRSIFVQQHRILDNYEEACRIADEQKSPLPDPANIGDLLPGTMIELLLVFWRHQAVRSAGSNEAVWKTFPPDWPSDVVDRAGERSERILPEGSTFARCEVRNHVGSGGFGDVYKVFQPPFEVPRALKILRGDKLWALSQTQQDRRGQTLFSEAVKLDQLSQNAIFPKVHDAGVYDGKHYVIMELLDGRTLWERQTSDSPLTPAEICRLGSKVAEGLDFAVQQGVIHGDISPKNILVMNSYGNEPKIIDFSAISQRPTDPTNATSVPETRMMSQFAGTIGYIAPEVLAGTAGHGEASEVFGLAATLYYAITGVTPSVVTAPNGYRSIKLVNWIDPDRFVSKSAHESAFSIFNSAMSVNSSDRPTLRQFAIQLGMIAKDFSQLPVALKAMNHVDTEVVPQTGHRSPVTACAVSADGALVATGSSDGSAILWDAQTGAVLRSFHAHKEEVDFVTLSADGRLALTGSSTEWRARLWNTATGKIVYAFPGRYRQAALSAGGAVAVGGGSGYDCELLQLKNGAISRFFRDADFIGIGLSADGELAAAVERTSDGSVTATIYSVRTKSHRNTFHIAYWDDKRPSVIAFSQDGASLISVCESQVTVWNAETGTKRLSFDVGVSVKHVALSADGRLAFLGATDRHYVAGEGDRTSLWDLNNGTKIRVFSPANYVRSIALSSDGKLACTGSEDGCTIWDTQTGSQLRILKGNEQTLRGGSRGSVATALNNGRLVLAVKWGAFAFDKNTCSRHKFQFATDRGVRVAASSDSTCVLAGHEDERIILDTRSGQSRTFSRKIGGTTDVLLNADGMMAFAGSITNACGILWDTHTSALHCSIEWTGIRTQSADMPKRFVDGKMVMIIPSYRGSLSAGPIAMSPDGSVFFAGVGDHASTLWNVATGKQLRTFQHGHHQITALGLSSNGALAVTGFYNGAATLWNSNTGEEIRQLKSHGSTIRLIIVSSDDNLILTGSDDRTAILWDLHTGVEQVVFKGHESPITALALSNDCKHVVTSGSDGTTRIWDTQTGDELCTLFVFDVGNHWLVVDPMGRFDCSEGGEHLVAFRTKGSHKLVPSARAKADHFTPGLLQSILAR